MRRRSKPDLTLIAGVIAGALAIAFVAYIAGFFITATPIRYGTGIGSFRAFGYEWVATIYRPVVMVESVIHGHTIHAVPAPGSGE